MHIFININVFIKRGLYCHKNKNQSYFCQLHNKQHTFSLMYFTITHNKSGYVDGDNEFVSGDFHDYFDLLKQAFKEKRCNLRRIFDESDDGGGGGAVKATNPADELAAVEVCVCLKVGGGSCGGGCCCYCCCCFFASSFFFQSFFIYFYFLSYSYFNKCMMIKITHTHTQRLS